MQKVTKNADYHLRSEFLCKGTNSCSDTDHCLYLYTSDCFYMAMLHMHWSLQLHSTRVNVTQWAQRTSYIS